MYSYVIRYMIFLGLHPSISFQYISVNACHVCSFVSDSKYCLLEPDFQSCQAAIAKTMREAREKYGAL